MLNSEATMELTLPDGAFTSPTPVTFSVKKLSGGGVETVGDNTLTHLETYAFDSSIPTLNSAAELNFQIDLSAMDDAASLPLLDLLHDGTLLTLGVLGESPGAEWQLFDVLRSPEWTPWSTIACACSGWMRLGHCSIRRAAWTGRQCALRRRSAISRPIAWWQ